LGFPPDRDVVKLHMAEASTNEAYEFVQKNAQELKKVKSYWHARCDTRFTKGTSLVRHISTKYMDMPASKDKNNKFLADSMMRMR